MTQIKFGTDGWRAIIADDYTLENVKRVAGATASWLIKNYKKPVAVIGYDTRFGGKLFSETVASVLASKEIKVYYAEIFSTTPMISLGTLKLDASLGIIITASHNPPIYNGIKLKGNYGGPLTPKKVEEIETLIADKFTDKIEDFSFYADRGIIEYINLEEIYLNQVKEKFDLTAIQGSKFKIAFDGMYGSGQSIIKKILPNAVLLHCENNPSFNGLAPEPIEKNLQELATLLKSKNNFDIGIAVDGDADRIGLYDHEGNFVDSHHLILLTIHYLHKYKKMSGKVCVAFSTTNRIRKMCEQYGLPLQISKIGFKYICNTMINEDVLLGGEESGGLAVKGHIPERDGIWMALLVLEFMAATGKNLKELINEVYEVVGKFGLNRYDIHIQEELKNEIVENCKNGKYISFGKYTVKQIDNLDGYKYFFNDDEWILIRPSGTEPVLRAYAESYSKEEANAILKAGKDTFLHNTPIQGR
jgi:phosphomannomutase